MESKHFNSVLDEKLIELVRVHPVLCNISNKNYKGNAVKENVWKEIAFGRGKSVS
jgi:hypothetical protein